MPCSSCHVLHQVKDYREGEVASVLKAIEGAEAKILEYKALQEGWEQCNSSSICCIVGSGKFLRRARSRHTKASELTGGKIVF